MPIYAFTDDNDGYYQVCIQDGESLPEWTNTLTPCEVQTMEYQPIIPSIVTMRQARLALLQTGLLASANSAIAALPGEAGDAARIEWEFSVTVERANSIVEILSSSLNLTDTQLDNLFQLASTL